MSIVAYSLNSRCWWVADIELSTLDQPKWAQPRWLTCHPYHGEVHLVVECGADLVGLVTPKQAMELTGIYHPMAALDALREQLE